MLKVDDVIAFLNTIGSLKKYIDVFHEEEIDGSALVETIAKDKDDLWLCIGIDNPMHRIKIRTKFPEFCLTLNS